MKTDSGSRFPSPSFLIALALLAVTTGAVVSEVCRGVDLSGGFVRRPRRAGLSASTDELRPPMAITIDGVSIRSEPPPAAGSARLIARTVTVSLSTDRFHDIRDAIDQLVARHHGALVGIVATTTGSSVGALSRRSLTATITVPVVEADAARLSARALGTLVQESPSTEDLTDGDRALLLRIEAARAEDRRLTGLLSGGTAGIPDIAGVERAQARARAEAERLTAEEMVLAARTAVVTLVLKIEGR